MTVASPEKGCSGQGIKVLFFLGAFWSVLKKSGGEKISILFQNVILPGGINLLTTKNSEKVKHPQICQGFGGNVGEA